MSTYCYEGWWRYVFDKVGAFYGIETQQWVTYINFSCLSFLNLQFLRFKLYSHMELGRFFWQAFKSSQQFFNLGEFWFWDFVRYCRKWPKTDRVAGSYFISYASYVNDVRKTAAASSKQEAEYRWQFHNKNCIVSCHLRLRINTDKRRCVFW